MSKDTSQIDYDLFRHELNVFEEGLGAKIKNTTRNLARALHIIDTQPLSSKIRERIKEKTEAEAEEIKKRNNDQQLKEDLTHYLDFGQSHLGLLRDSAVSRPPEKFTPAKPAHLPMSAEAIIEESERRREKAISAMYEPKSDDVSLTEAKAKELRPNRLGRGEDL